MTECKEVLYLYLHSKIGEPVLNTDRLMSIHEVEWRMAQWRIPNKLKPLIIKVWEDMGIVKKIDRRTIEFIRTNFNVEDMGEIYTELNLF